MRARRAFGLFVAMALVAAGCGDGGGAAPGDAAMGADAARDLDAHVPRDGAMDAGGDAAEMDARATPDSALRDAGETSDAGETPDGGPADATIEDAGAPVGSVAACEVPSMVDQYPGFFPPNPYGTWEAASECISAEHDVIVVLGCPSNADGTPSTCQTTRADLAVALSSAGYGRRFITTGAAVHNAYVEAEALRTLLMERGIVDTDIVVEPLAEHTDENLYYASRIMQDRAWQTAVVVSDDAGHLIFTGLCDANCCVQLGRMTVLDFEVADRAPVRAGHYVLDPHGPPVTPEECAFISSPTKALCLNRAMRRACADDFRL